MGNRVLNERVKQIRWETVVGLELGLELRWDIAIAHCSVNEYSLFFVSKL